jgi:hypothetical protein
MHQDAVAGFGAFDKKWSGERIAGFGVAHVTAQVAAARIDGLRSDYVTGVDSLQYRVRVGECAVVRGGNKGLRLSGDCRCGEQQQDSVRHGSRV